MLHVREEIKSIARSKYLKGSLNISKYEAAVVISQPEMVEALSQRGRLTLEQRSLE